MFQKDRKQSDPWLPDAPAYVQFWRDVPGHPDRRREVAALGPCRTRTIAERRAAEKIESLGINSTQTFRESNSNTTFRQQGETWLRSLANRKRNPLEQTTINTRRCAMDKWIYPHVGNLLLAEVNNRDLKELVEGMSKTLAPATIRDYVCIVKDVVSSAINENGEELFPRKWNEEYIDAPIIGKQNQPSICAEETRKVIDEATGQYRVLYALLAGCGPLRVGEALGLEIRHISSDFRTLAITQKAKYGKIQTYLKTINGEREVDLCSELSEMLREFVGTRTEGLVFQNRNGGAYLQTNLIRGSLHPILAKLGLPIGGFNIFRRYRLTHVDKSECPQTLKHFWSGHAAAHVSERYIKLRDDRVYRIGWAERIGMGFNLPPNGQPGQLLVMRKSA